MSELDSNTADNSEQEAQTKNRDIPDTVESPSEESQSSLKEKKPVGCFDLVAVVALVFGALCLILILILVSSLLNLQPGGQQQINQLQSTPQVNQPDSTQQDIEMLQARIDNLLSIQMQVNSSLLDIVSQLNRSFLNFQAEVNKSNEDILGRTLKQRDIIIQELEKFEVYKNTTIQEITNLQLNENSQNVGIKTCKNEILKIADHLSTVVDVELLILKENIEIHAIELKTLIDGLTSINSTIQGLDTITSSKIGSFERPATSCKDIPQGSPSGMYWIQAQIPFQVYCDFSRRNCSCGTSEAWMRVANIDMTDSTQQCPSLFQLITRTQPPRRTCGRQSGAGGCVSTTFSGYGMEYSRVCGRVVGYQYGSPSGFDTGMNDIDSHYLAGISLTHGRVRQHIWSLVNAQGEGYTGEVCPCIQGSSQLNVPSFVGNDYFCDSAIRGRNANEGQFYPNDPLWDGQGCGSTSTCCEFNNPPWFCKELSRPTTDDIEMRLCENSASRYDDTPFEIVELYIN